jgi:hypothetical protein
MPRPARTVVDGDNSHAQTQRLWEHGWGADNRVDDPWQEVQWTRCAPISYDPLPRMPDRIGYKDRFKNGWYWDPRKQERDVQLSRTGKEQLGHLSNSGNHVNVGPDGYLTH